MIIEAVNGGTIFIGRLGENEARVIRFCVKETLASFPGCTFALVNKRPADAEGYPSPNIAINGDFLDWTVTSGDLAQTGFGECEIIATLGDRIVKNEIFRTQIKPALDDSATPPEPWESWVQEVTEAAEQAEAAVEHYPQIEDGVWMVWDVENETWTSTGIQAEGEDGVSPTVSVVEISGGHRVTITDASGDHTFDVMDGQGGSGSSDYEDLSNKPQIGGVELVGNKSLSDLGAAAASDIPDVTGKADKVANATSGNFAGLDSNGNLTDSGKKASDFLTEHQDISGKLDKTDFFATEMPMASNDSTKVSAEISGLKSALNGKISEPETEGTSGQFLQTDGNGGRTWATPSGSGGTSDYADLTNKPQINSVMLSGNKSLSDLGVASETDIATLKADYFIPDIVSTGYISNSDGSEQSNANYSRSDYIDISKYKKLISIGTYDGAFNAFYTSAKVFISSFVVRAGTDKVVEIPSNAVYMRVSTTTANYNDTYKFRRLDYVDSVRISDLNDAVGDLSDAIEHIGDTFFPPSVGTGNVSRDNGSIVSSSYLHSDYIDISQFPKLLTVSDYTGDFNAFYDANKTFISAFSIATGTDKIIEIPDGAMYMRVSASSTKYADTMKFRSVDYVKSDVLPAYWFGHIAGKCDAIRNNMNVIGKNGETFAFVTDIHWYRNQQYSPKLIRYLLDRLNINMVALGGDMIAQGTKTEELEESWKSVEAFRFNDTFVPIAFGNHDNNSNQEEASYRFDTNTIYSMFFKGFEDSVTFMTDTEFSFYFDKPVNKTRYIFLDMGDDGVSRAFTAYTGFRDALLSTPSGYKIVVVAHIIDYGTFKTDLTQMIDAYNARSTVTVSSVVCDFTSGAGTVVICIGGHRHYDAETATSGGVPITVTDCDAFLSSNSETKGTITEQAFDVISLDYTNSLAYYERVGRGKNRIFHLTPVASSTTLTTSLTGTITWSSGDTTIATVSNGTITRLTTGTVVIKASNGTTDEVWVCNS